MATGKTCCCGCCSVCVGTKIIAVLSIICGVSAVWALVTVLTVISDSNSELASTLTSNISESSAVKGYLHPREPEPESESDEWIREQKNPLIFCLTITIVEIILSGMLLHGANSNKASFCHPWLIFNYATFVLLVIGSIAGFISVCVSLDGSYPGLLVAFIFAAVVAIAFRAYFIKVVYDFRQELRDDASCRGGGGSYMIRGMTTTTTTTALSA